MRRALNDKLDSPKGDLGMSASSLTPTVLVGSTVYPCTTVLVGSTVYLYGTTEHFPNSSHYCMECLNKDICDRKSGECEC